jgi:hypothetical protein
MNDDRQVLLREAAAALDMIEAAAGTDSLTREFAAAANALLAVIDSRESVIRVLYNLSRLCAYHMASTAVLHGETVQQVLHQTRLGLMTAADTL